MLVIALFIVHFSRVYRVDLNAAFGQLDHPAAVILVGVREEHALQMRHIQRLKIAFQRVKLLFQSGVDQIVAFAQPHQNRVGLAHIEGNDLDVQAVRFRFSGNRAAAQQKQRRQQRRQRPLGIWHSSSLLFFIMTRRRAKMLPAAQKLTIVAESKAESRPDPLPACVFVYQAS